MVEFSLKIHCNNYNVLYLHFQVIFRTNIYSLDIGDVNPQRGTDSIHYRGSDRASWILQTHKNTRVWNFTPPIPNIKISYLKKYKCEWNSSILIYSIKQMLLMLDAKKLKYRGFKFSTPKLCQNPVPLICTEWVPFSPLCILHGYPPPPPPVPILINKTSPSKTFIAVLFWRSYIELL